jgi:hypothetical protein
MFPFKPFIESSVESSIERGGGNVAHESPGSAGHASATISPALVASPEQLGLSRFPVGAGPQTPNRLPQRAHAGTRGSEPSSNRPGPIASTSGHARPPDGAGASMPEDLRQVQSMLGLNQPKDWDELQQFLQHQVSAAHATRREASPQTPSTSQGLDHIRSQAQLTSSDDWAAWTRFVDELRENTQPAAPTVAASHPRAVSGSPSVAPVTPGIPGVDLPPILENAALQPRDRNASIPIAGRQPLRFLHDTNVTYGPRRADLRKYVATFLRQYGYQVDILPAHGGLGLLRAINPRTLKVFHVYARTSARGYINRPLTSLQRDASTPQPSSHILAVVENNELAPARLGLVHLIHL